MLFGLLILGLAGCSSKTLKPNYFTLTSQSAISPNKEQSSVEAQAYLHDGVIGLGPIDIADIYERAGVVTFSGAKVDISDRFFWGGKLSTAISRKLAQDLKQRMPDTTFWSFPWDTRVRPKTQLGISVLEVGGELGGQVNLVVSWRLLGDRGRTLIKTGEFKSSNKSDIYPTNSRSYLAYVEAINACVDELVVFLSAELSGS